MEKFRPLRDGLYEDSNGSVWVNLYEDVWGGTTSPLTFDVKTKEIKKMIIDDIMVAGLYVDRRGRVWEYSGNPGLNEWFADIPGDPLERGWWCSPKEMRLLIERDMHRDECIGMFECNNHPVPAVFVGGTLGHPEPSFGVMIEGTPAVARYGTLSDAMDAAKRLA